MIRYLALIRHLVERDFYLRHTGSALGILWSVLVPLAQLAVLTFTFTNVIRVDIQDYPAFVFSALLPWTWFSNSLAGAGHLFFANRDLLRRPSFPPSALIVVNALTHLTTFFLSLPLLFGLMMWYGRVVIWNPVTFLSLLFIQGILIVGLSFFIATWNVFYRDIAQLIGILLSLLFFLTPIFYRPIIGGQYSEILAMNPLTPLFNSYRTVLYEGKSPDVGTLALIGGISLLICSLGYILYTRKLPDVVDAI